MYANGVCHYNDYYSSIAANCNGYTTYTFAANTVIEFIDKLCLCSDLTDTLAASYVLQSVCEQTYASAQAALTACTIIFRF